MSHKKLAKLLVVAVFTGLFGWWLWANSTSNEAQKELFSDFYWALPLLSGVIGFFAAKKWGGFKSLFGKAVIFLSLGLLAQVFGQVVSSYYARIQHVEIPYPSVGDIGFFGAIVFYVLGAYYLTRTVSGKFSLRKTSDKVLVIAVPLALLAGSYYIFLRGYQYDFSQFLTTFLDFGYPLGDALYVSIAILAFLLSRKLLGGFMRKRILLILGALLVQYIADFTFLYKFSRDTYTAGSSTDLIYLLAYLLMGLALLSLISAYDAILKPRKVEPDE